MLEGSGVFLFILGWSLPCIECILNLATDPSKTRGCLGPPGIGRATSVGMIPGELTGGMMSERPPLASLKARHL